MNKEEIKKGLTEELNKTITANECGLSTNDFSENIKILESALEYIEQLENKVKEQDREIKELIRYKENCYDLTVEKQELIKMLEEDNKQDTESIKRYKEMRRNCQVDSVYKKSYQTRIHNLNARRELRNNILSKLKGEND